MKIKVIGKYALSALLGVIFSIPVVTIADAITAMHFVNFKLVKDAEINVYKEFIKSFKQNFKQSLSFLLILGIFGAALGYSWYSLLTAEGDVNFLIGSLLLIASILYFNFECLSTYLLSKFENTTKRLMLIALYASMKHVDTLFRTSLLEICIVAIPVIVLIVNPSVVTLIVAGVLFLLLLTLLGIFSAKFVTPIFDELIKQDENKETDEA